MNEAEIITACQEGAHEKFAELYDQYADPIFRFIFHKTFDRELAEDLTGDVFLRAMEKIDSFNADRGKFSTWLYTIARNRITDHWRSHREHSDVDDVWDLASLDDVADAANKKLMGEQLHAAMQKLSPDAREILTLRFWQDLSWQQVADITEKSESAVKMSASRSIKSLRADAPTFAAFLLFSLLIK